MCLMKGSHRIADLKELIPSVCVCARVHMHAHMFLCEDGVAAGDCV